MKELPEGYFSRVFDQSNPGLILFLLDQSSSMKEKIGSRPKSNVAASAINQTIETLIERCRRGASIIEKADVGVIGYGAQTRYELIDGIAALNESFTRIETQDTEVSTPSGRQTLAVEHKIWIEPRHENSTPMAEALDMAATKLREWVDKYPDAPPPVVINVTDGIPNDLQNRGDGSATRAAAARLRTLGADVELCLLLCVHIATDSATPILFPAQRSDVNGRYQQLLFDISSVLPTELFSLAKNKGLAVTAGSKLLAINSSPNDLLRVLDFGSSTSMPDAHLM
jgi:uncharacterized protein YegL